MWGVRSAASTLISTLPHAHTCAAGGPLPAAETSRAQASTCHAGNAASEPGTRLIPPATALLRNFQSTHTGFAWQESPRI